MKLSVILPTLNRPSLSRALASCQGADEVLVVADGAEAHAAEGVFLASGLPGRVIKLSRRYQDFGHTPRQIALGFATGDWIAYLDDDDVFVPGFRDLLTTSLQTTLPHFFRVHFDELGLVWREPFLYLGNISTIGIVHPNNHRWGLWEPVYAGDYYFAASTAALYSEVRWVDKILARCEHHHYGK